jgi:MerR family transcriptional regulator/heat shock protein HspR
MASSPFDDEHAPLYTVGQVAELLAVKQAFLRRVDELRVVSPQRSRRPAPLHAVRDPRHPAGRLDGRRRHHPAGDPPHHRLERQLAEVTRERDELARRLSDPFKPNLRNGHWYHPNLSALSSPPGRPPMPPRARTPVLPPRARTPLPPRAQTPKPPEPPKPPRAARAPAARRRARPLGGRQQLHARGQRQGALRADPFQRVLAVRRDGQGARAGVARVGAPAHVAAVFQRRHQPGQRRRRDSLGGGQISQPHRPGMPTVASAASCVGVKPASS